jgi:hypothetical protein
MSTPLDDATDAVMETFHHCFDSKERCREVLGVAFGAAREHAPARIGTAIAFSDFQGNIPFTLLGSMADAALGEAVTP